MSFSVTPSCHHGIVRRHRPEAVCRTARVRLRLTRAQRRRCIGLLRAAGDVWAGLIDYNRERLRRDAPPMADFLGLCRELTGVRVGELSRTCAEGVARRYSDAWFEANRRRRQGAPARYPRRKKALMPVRFRTGQFVLEGSRLRLQTARGAGPLRVRLSRDLPYPPGQVRAVTLLMDAGRVVADVTAEISPSPSPGSAVAGVDPGIIHPFALAWGDKALLVSGRALRAEERLHLADSQARARKMAAKAPRRGQRGSRRWRKLRVAQRRAEARHRRRIRQAHHQAAKAVIAWAIEHEVGTLVVGDPAGICDRDSGAVHNLRLRQWRRTHRLRALVDKAGAAGIKVTRVDERGSSSTCPECGKRVPKPRGRRFVCPHCGHVGHRDIVGARNIAAKGGGHTSTPVLVEHRRAGQVPARRDRRRHLWDARRSCLAPGRPGPPGSRSPLLSARNAEVLGHTVVDVTSTSELVH